MTVQLRADVAHVVAKLIAQRATRVDEIPMLMREVQIALERMAEPPAAMVREPAPMPDPPRPTRTARPRPMPQSVEKPSEPPSAPRLLRRADMVTPPARETAAPLGPVPVGVLRGVVKWF